MKRYSALAGVALMGALALTGCEAGEGEPVRLDGGVAFQSDTQVELGAGTLGGTLLDRGVAWAEVIEKPEDGDKKPLDFSGVIYDYDLRYKQYDGQGEGWSSRLSHALTPEVVPTLFSISWRGKDYVVAVQETFRDTERSDSIEKGVKSHLTLVDVFDASNGDRVNEFELTSPGSAQPWHVIKSESGIFAANQEADGGESTVKVIDPLTGGTIKTHGGLLPSMRPVGAVQNDVAITTSKDLDHSLEVRGLWRNEGMIGLATHGDYVLAQEVKDEEPSDSILLLDGGTGEAIGSVECPGQTVYLTDVSSTVGDDPRLIASPNNRYIAYNNVVAFDTETCDGFCGLETERQKPVSIDILDNGGHAYGDGGTGFFTLDLRTGKGELSPDDDNVAYPLSVTKDGVGIFRSSSVYDGIVTMKSSPVDQ